MLFSQFRIFQTRGIWLRASKRSGASSVQIFYFSVLERSFKKRRVVVKKVHASFIAE